MGRYYTASVVETFGTTGHSTIPAIQRWQQDEPVRRPNYRHIQVEIGNIVWLGYKENTS